MYEYLISRQNSPELFKRACDILRNKFPYAKKHKLLVDVDGSTIQTFTVNGKDIDVFDAYDYGTVFIKSEIDLGEMFENTV